MLTNNTNTQNQQVTGRLAQTMTVAAAFALLLSVFTANLSAANLLGTALASRSASVASKANVTSKVAKTAASTGTGRAAAGLAKTQTAKQQLAKTATTKTNNLLPTTPSGKMQVWQRGKVSPTRPPSGPETTVAASSFHGANGLVRQNTLGMNNRISDDRFRAQFGSTHTFHIDHVVMMGGRPHFWFGGFAFGIVDPWPADWLDGDAEYVDSVGGVYYLCSPLHPGIRVVLSLDDSNELPVASAADESAPAPVADAGSADPTDSSAPASITRGETPDQVVAALGSPASIVKLGARTIYLYNNMKVTFVAGRLRDAK
jgi:hypothetical protein